MLKNKGKKALSPVIATVLLIALVVVLAAIVFLWARAFIGEQIEKTVGDNTMTSDEACSQVDFDAELLDFNELQVVNRGNIPIYGFNIKQVNGGDEEIKEIIMPIEQGKTAAQSVDLIASDKIIVYPQILGNVKGKTINKAYTCLEQGKELNAG